MNKSPFQRLSALNLSQDQNTTPQGGDGGPTTTKKKKKDESSSSGSSKVVVVFSGGTAMNCVAPFMTTQRPTSAQKEKEEKEKEEEQQEISCWSHRVTHVLPVSDDGGSTAEICRVLGGPAVGDIRSRCLRLSDSFSIEGKAVNALLARRLSLDPKEAKDEWHSIVEGEHLLWENISEPYKNTIRAFLVHFHSQVLRVMDLKFNFSNGSIGNYFFAGARIFFRSLEAAIFLYSRVSGIPEGNEVLPTVCTEGRLTLGAELRDGTVIRGQNQISHPSQSSSVVPSPIDSDDHHKHDDHDSASTSHLEVSKGDDYELLGSPISRVMYLSYEGMTHEHEIRLDVNPRVRSQLSSSSCVVYGMGSLYTSLCPSLILNGVGECIAGLERVHKILLINGWHDREIAGYSAVDCLEAVCSSLNRKPSSNNSKKKNKTGEGDCYELHHAPSQYVTHVIAPRGGHVYQPEKDKEHLVSLGIQVVEVDSHPAREGKVRFDAEALVKAIDQIVASNVVVS